MKGPCRCTCRILSTARPKSSSASAWTASRKRTAAVLPGFWSGRQAFPRGGQVFPRVVPVAAQQGDPGAEHAAVDLLDADPHLLLQALHGHEVGVGVVEPAEAEVVLALGPQQHGLTRRPGVRRLPEQSFAGREVVHVQVRDDLFGR
ncbi:hypothetical protein SGLAM104S_00379 [Streptomyces glaucescens]